LIYKYEVALAGLIFVISFSTDVFAYLTGKLFGKKKLAPKISPNKTIEGSLGELIFCTTISALFAFLTGLDVIYVTWIGALGSIVAQCGDLFASSIKRYCGIKDFGKLIPGHGGILDRFDSVMFVAVFIQLFT
jgi:phosphatidate cytidylyltransferase